MNTDKLLKLINEALISEEPVFSFAPHCWEKKDCRDETCPIYNSPGELCWEQNKPECANCSYKPSLSNQDVFLLNLEQLCVKYTDFRRKASIYKQILEASQPVFKVGQEVRKVSHEINNIIGTMSGYVQLATMTSDTKYLNQTLNTVSQGCKRISEIIAHLRKIRKDAELSLECPSDCFREVFDSMFVEMQQKNIDWDVKSKEKIWILAKSLPLQKLVFLLVKSVIDSLQNNGKITIRVDNKDRNVTINLMIQKLAAAQNTPYQLTLPFPIVSEPVNSSLAFDESKLKNLVKTELADLKASVNVKEDGQRVKIQLVLPML